MSSALPQPDFSERRSSARCLLPRLLLVLVLLVGMVSACTEDGTEEPPAKTISLPDDVLQDKAVLDVLREDTDTDADKEWVVFYRFDRVNETGPVAALIYDVVVDLGLDLPIVYPYKLRIPQENYLAQVQPKVALIDLINEPAGVTPRKELLFHTDNELAFFEVERNLVNQAADDPPLYRCVGFFRSADGVKYNEGNHEVEVTSRTAYERSQLVARRYYQPGEGGYFAAGTTNLLPPTGSKVDFPSGIPEDILDTPYPEKIVLAFYQTFGQSGDGPVIIDYLTAPAADQFMKGTLRYGWSHPLEKLKLAVVKELRYYATEDASQAAVVVVQVVFHNTEGEKSSLIEVRWTLKRVDNQWKMDFPQP